MGKRNYFCLLVMLLFAFVMLPAPTIADTVTCPEGSPAGALCGSEIDSFGNIWMVQSTATAGACKDSKNRAVTGTLFFYEISVKDPDENPIAPSLNQSNVDYTICDVPETDWSITYPLDRSIKKLLCDPNSGFRCDDFQKGVITWSALKALPDLHYEYLVCIDGASIKEATTRLETGNGYVDVFPTLGPGCCGATQTLTQINNVVGVGTGPTLTVDSGLCSFEPDVVSYGGDPQDPIPGLAHCKTNTRTGEVDKNTCVKIKKFGPESGLYVLSKIDPKCVETTCPGYAYYGWGNKIYQFYTSVPGVVEFSCSPDFKNVPRKGSVVVDDLYEFVPDGCGNGSIYIKGETDPIAGPDTPIPTVWLVPYDSSGKLNLSEASVVVSGSAEGVVFYNGCAFIGGRRYCW